MGKSNPQTNTRISLSVFLVTDSHQVALQLAKLVQPILACRIAPSTTQPIFHNVSSASQTTICSRIPALCAVKVKGLPSREGVPSVPPTDVISVSKDFKKCLTSLDKGPVLLAHSPHSIHSTNWNQSGAFSVLRQTQASANIVRLVFSGVPPIRSVVN